MNSTVVGSIVASFICPSDGQPLRVEEPGVGPYSRQSAVQSNYLVNAATYTENNCPGASGTGTPVLTSRGTFYNDMSTTIADIKDGTSNTFLVGESIQGIGKFLGTSSAYADKGYGYGPYWGSGVHTSTHGRILPPTHRQAGACAPNGPSSIFYPAVTAAYRNKPYAWVFSSHHPGGVNMALSDGSVRFIKNTVNLYTWWSLATIAGGEVISADSF